MGVGSRFRNVEGEAAIYYYFHLFIIKIKLLLLLLLLLLLDELSLSVSHQRLIFLVKLSTISLSRNFEIVSVSTFFQ